MKERLRELAPKLLRYLGYPLFFFTFFVLFVYWTFPYDRLKEFIIHQVEAPRPTAAGTMASSNIALEIDSLGPTFFPGLRARGVRVTWLPQRTGDRPITARIDSVTVHVGLFALLFGRLNGDVELEGMGGTLNTHVEAVLNGSKAGLRELTVKMQGVNAGEIGPLVQAVGLPIQGRMDTDLTLSSTDGQLTRATGRLQLSISALKIGDSVAQFQIPGFGGVTIAQIDAGTLAGTVNIREGVIQVDRLNTRSRELTLALSGRIELANNPAETGINLLTRFQLTDVYRAKNEQAGRIMMVLDVAPDLRAAKQPDGSYALRCRGTTGRGIRCVADTGAAPGTEGTAAGGFGEPRRGF
jgi:type II secretion system protein N